MIIMELLGVRLGIYPNKKQFVFVISLMMMLSDANLIVLVSEVRI